MRITFPFKPHPNPSLKERGIHSPKSNGLKLFHAFQKLFVSLFFFFAFHFSPFTSRAQTAAQIIDKVNHNFAKVNDYTADMNIHLDISFIKMKDITAKVFFKKPKKFKVKAEGIVVLPKQNPNYMMAMLQDTTSYNAIKTGTEIINDVTTTIISVIPNADTADLILGKFWVDANRGLILKSHLTTKSNGTLEIEHFYGSNSTYALPDKLIFTIETAKFKLPKALVADLSSNSSADDKTENKKGKITILFGDYLINKGIDDKIFK